MDGQFTQRVHLEKKVVEPPGPARREPEGALPFSWRRTLISQQSTNSHSVTAPTHAEPAGTEPGSIDVRARAVYRELRERGFRDADIMAFAGELLSLVATDVRSAAAAE